MLVRPFRARLLIDENPRALPWADLAPTLQAGFSGYEHPGFGMWENRGALGL